MKQENTFEKIKIPALSLRAGFEPATFDAKTRTVSVTWSTGAKVLRGGLFTEPFYEALDMSPGAVRMDRLRNGAPLLNAHSSCEITDQIGVVENPTIENGRGLASVRFSSREDVAPILQDVQDGIVRNVSVGYQVYKYQDISGENDKIRTLLATDWEPFELSMVPINADAGAQVRSGEKILNECEIEIRSHKTNSEENTMSLTAAVTEAAKPEASTVENDSMKREITQNERKRASEITLLARKHGIDSDVCLKLIESDVSLDQARSQILDILAERSAKDQIHTQIGVEVTRDAEDTRREGAIEALLHRHDPMKNKASEKAFPFVGMSLLRLAEDCVVRKGIKVTGMGKMELARRAFESTSDFSNILSNVANKTLRMAYDNAPQTFRPFVRQVFNPDFKQVSRVQLSEAPKMELVNQSGEIKYGAMSDTAEKYALLTYAKIVAINRQVVINDDLEAFTRIPALYGRAAADLESDIVYGILTANAAMSDGVTLFHANHGNLGTAGAISEVTLGEARKKMRLQSGLLSGKDKQLLNIMAKYLIVPAALETTAQKQLAIVTPKAASDVNPFSGLYVLIPEPRLDANSATAWYMAGDPSQIDTIELAYLQGQPGIYTESRQGFEVDGLEIKCRLDVAAKAIDHRGLFKNAGA